jgi:hypothetical protein
MAWIQQDPSGNFHIRFRFGRRKFNRSLKTSVPKQAQLKKLRPEETIAQDGSLVVNLPAYILANSSIRHWTSLCAFSIHIKRADFGMPVESNRSQG